MPFFILVSLITLMAGAGCGTPQTLSVPLSDISASSADVLHDRADTALRADEAAFREHLRRNPEDFRDGQLYVSLIDRDARLLGSSAQGAGASVGRDLGALRDCTGKFFIRELVQLARSQNRGTYEYCWMNPETGRVATKFTNFRRVGELILTVSGWK